MPNFAQGEMALATSFFAMMLLTSMKVSFVPAMILTIVFSLALGAFLGICHFKAGKGSQYLRNDCHHHWD